MSGFHARSGPDRPLFGWNMHGTKAAGIPCGFRDEIERLTQFRPQGSLRFGTAGTGERTSLPDLNVADRSAAAEVWALGGWE